MPSRFEAKQLAQRSLVGATGQDIKTDCSINAQLEGKTYCFGSKDAMAEFMKSPKENLAKAHTYYSKKHPG